MRSGHPFVLLAAMALLSACGDRSVDEPSSSCRVRMLDSHNSTDTLLQVKAQSTTHLIVTDRIDSTDPWSVTVKILGDGALDMDVNVPSVTTQQLVDKYVMTDNAQLTFVPVEGHACTAFERSLAFFLIMEWFYFG
jgi:hypothetical protein